MRCTRIWQNKHTYTTLQSSTFLDYTLIISCRCTNSVKYNILCDNETTNLCDHQSLVLNCDLRRIVIKCLAIYPHFQSKFCCRGKKYSTIAVTKRNVTKHVWSSYLWHKKVRKLYCSQILHHFLALLANVGDEIEKGREQQQQQQKEKSG